MQLPLALSTQGWTAAAAIGGALIGATAGGVVERWGERIRSRRLAKAGARLLAIDLEIADDCLLDALNGGELKLYYEFGVPAWAEYRKVLAEELGDFEFRAVAEAAMSIDIIRKHTSDADGFTDEERYDRVAQHLNVGNVRDLVAAGYNALAGIAGHQPVTGTIQESLVQRSSEGGGP
jgi:hypothetical protein